VSPGYTVVSSYDKTVMMMMMMMIRLIRLIRDKTEGHCELLVTMERSTGP